jgi:hypothetical protein
VALLELDPDRITALLYGGHACHDRDTLAVLDAAWCRTNGVAATGSRQGFGWGWRRTPARPSGLRPQVAAGRRNAPPATPPARREVR